jgi:hypothetical protein
MNAGDRRLTLPGMGGTRAEPTVGTWPSSAVGLITYVGSARSAKDASPGSVAFTEHAVSDPPQASTPMQRGAEALTRPDFARSRALRTFGRPVRRRPATVDWTSGQTIDTGSDYPPIDSRFCRQATGPHAGRPAVAPQLTPPRTGGSGHELPSTRCGGDQFVPTFPNLEGVSSFTAKLLSNPWQPSPT